MQRLLYSKTNFINPILKVSRKNYLYMLYYKTVLSKFYTKTWAVFQMLANGGDGKFLLKTHSMYLVCCLLEPIISPAEINTLYLQYQHSLH